MIALRLTNPKRAQEKESTRPGRKRFAVDIHPFPAGDFFMKGLKNEYICGQSCI